MLIIRVGEAAILIAFVLFMVTQILWPAVYGTLMFPLFRKTGELEKELAEAKQEVSDIRLSQKVDKVRKEAEALVTKQDPKP